MVVGGVCVVGCVCMQAKDTTREVECLWGRQIDLSWTGRDRLGGCTGICIRYVRRILGLSVFLLRLVDSHVLLFRSDIPFPLPCLPRHLDLRLHHLRISVVCFAHALSLHSLHRLPDR